MKRRDFLAASCLAGMAPATNLFAAPGAGGDSEREYYEWRSYSVASGPKEEALDAFLAGAAIPAWNRLGIKPVGVFREMESESPTRHALLAHPSLETVVEAGYRLLSDEKFLEAGAAFLNAPKNDPAFERIESTLMIAFSRMPKLVVPEKKPSRIFELRRYESHSEKFGAKKVEMFNEGGEIDIFLSTGLTPVFFGETLIGTMLPNLTYMLVFDDMADHDADWAAFQKSPGWIELKDKEEYKGTVSRITKTFLKPMEYSQL